MTIIVTSKFERVDGLDFEETSLLEYDSHFMLMNAIDKRYILSIPTVTLDESKKIITTVTKYASAESMQLFKEENPNFKFLDTVKVVSRVTTEEPD